MHQQPVDVRQNLARFIAGLRKGHQARLDHRSHAGGVHSVAGYIPSQEDYRAVLPLEHVVEITAHDGFLGRGAIEVAEVQSGDFAPASP